MGAKLVTYSQHVQALADLMRGIDPVVGPKIYFAVVGDPNDKEAIKRTLRFPPEATQAHKDEARRRIDNFPGLFKQANQ